MMFERGSAESEMLYALSRTGDEHLKIALGLGVMTRDAGATILASELVLHAGSSLSEEVRRRGDEVFTLVCDEVCDMVASFEGANGRMGDIRFLCQSLYAGNGAVIRRLEALIAAHPFALLPVIILVDRDYARLRQARAHG